MSATSYRRSIGSNLDQHALSLFRRAGLRVTATYWPGTPYQISGKKLLLALSLLSNGLKHTIIDGATLWDRHDFIYPFVGNTLAAHLCNLKTLDASADGTLFGGASYDLSGQGFRLTDGGPGHIDTNYAPLSVLPLDSNHLSVYLTRDPNPGAVQVEIGGAETRYFDLLVQLNGLVYFENDAGGMMSAAVSSALGYTTGTRTAAYLASLYKNGQLLATDTTHTNAGYTAVNGSQPISIGIGARRAYNSNLQSTRTFAFASCGRGKTRAQEAATYALVQEFQTRLGRQV